VSAFALFVRLRGLQARRVTPGAGPGFARRELRSRILNVLTVPAGLVRVRADGLPRLSGRRPG
jgi:hypothetical protein